MMDIRHMSCCGFRELSYIGGQTPEENMERICRHYAIHGRLTVEHLALSHAVFTATGRAKYGRAFAAYITQHKLGDLVCSTLATNPNSGNKIQGWIWTLDREALVKWYKAQNTSKSKVKG